MLHERERSLSEREEKVTRYDIETGYKTFQPISSI